MLLGDARRLLQLEEAARHRLAAPRLSGVVRLGAVEEVAGDTRLGCFGTDISQTPSWRKQDSNSRSRAKRRCFSGFRTRRTPQVEPLPPTHAKGNSEMLHAAHFERAVR
jgi:hypothetical protein